METAVSDSGESYAWLQQFGLPTDGSLDMVDTDGDGLNNWQEWRCGADPTNASSVWVKVFGDLVFFELLWELRLKRPAHIDVRFACRKARSHYEI